MRKKRHRNNFIKVDGIFVKYKKRIFIVIKFILAIGKKICQRKPYLCGLWRFANAYKRLEKERNVSYYEKFEKVCRLGIINYNVFI